MLLLELYNTAAKTKARFECFSKHYFSLTIVLYIPEFWHIKTLNSPRLA